MKLPYTPGQRWSLLPTARLSEEPAFNQCVGQRKTRTHDSDVNDHHRNMNMCEDSRAIGPQSLSLQNSARYARFASLGNSEHIFGWMAVKCNTFQHQLAGRLHRFHHSLSAMISVPSGFRSYLVRHAPFGAMGPLVRPEIRGVSIISCCSS